MISRSERDTIAALAAGTLEGTDSIMPMQDSTAVMFEQSFANQHQASQHAFRRMQDGQDNVAEQTRLGFLLTQQLVGAKAAGNLNMDPLGKSILDQRSVRDQPGHPAT